MKKIIFFIFIVLFSCKSKDNIPLTEYENKAIQDIKADSVKIFTYGLPFISPLENERKIQEIRKYKLDSVYKNYGLYKQNLGCVIGDKKMDKAIKEYHKITNLYLDKRNGKGWREKMEKDLNSVDVN